MQSVFWWPDVRLAIEVADSSLKFDLTEKAALYAEAGIGEYWVVDASAKQIHVFREPVDGEYALQTIARESASVSPAAATDAVFKVSALFSDEL